MKGVLLEKSFLFFEFFLEIPLLEIFLNLGMKWQDFHDLKYVERSRPRFKPSKKRRLYFGFLSNSAKILPLFLVGGEMKISSSIVFRRYS